MAAVAGSNGNANRKPIDAQLRSEMADLVRSARQRIFENHSGHSRQHEFAELRSRYRSCRAMMIDAEERLIKALRGVQ